MPKGVNYPLYIPPSCADVAKLVESKQSQAAIELLQKKVQFRNGEAAALLAYIHLRGAAPREGFAAVFDRCKEAANAGEAYAEFVVAQVYQSADRYREALEWLQRSSEQQFPPAMSQMGRLMAEGKGFPRPDRKSAMRMYRLALKYHHVPTLILVSKNLMLSRNPFAWLSGVLLAPIALLIAAICLRLAPFNLANFAHISGDNPPLFSMPKPDTGR